MKSGSLKYVPCALASSRHGPCCHGPAKTARYAGDQQERPWSGRYTHGRDSFMDPIAGWLMPRVPFGTGDVYKNDSGQVLRRSLRFRSAKACDRQRDRRATQAPTATSIADNAVCSGGAIPPAGLTALPASTGACRARRPRALVGVPLVSTHFTYTAARSRFGKTEKEIGQFIPAGAQRPPGPLSRPARGRPDQDQGIPDRHRPP